MLQVSDLQLQVIAFILEFIGLTLAFIEVRMPSTAAKIARFLGMLAAPIADLRNRSLERDKAHARLSSSLGKLLNTVLTLGTLPVIILFAVSAIEAANADSLTATWLIPQLITLVVQLLVVSLGLLLLCLILYFTVAGGSDFATRFVEGRAVGTLGIMLAALGLVMELYQLIAVV